MAPRIALVHSMRYFGSTEAGYLKPLLERLDGPEFEPWLIVPDDPTLEPLTVVPSVRDRTIRVALPAFAGAVTTVRHYARALRLVRPDIVHCIEVDPPAMLAAWAARVRRVIVTHHTPEFEPRYNLTGRLLRRLAWSTRPHVIFTSEQDRRTALAREPIAAERSVVIPLSVDLERFSREYATDRLRSELGLAGERVVGTVGLLKPQKAHANLIEAAVRVVAEEPDVRFVVVGGGALFDALSGLVGARGLEGRFFLLGQRDDVQDLVVGFDLFVLSSVFEGMCLAVAEALALEKPVIATSVGGVPQTVIDGKTGYLVAPADPAALAKAILWALRHPDEAKATAVAGRERVNRMYSHARMVEETTRLYRRLSA